MELGGEGELKGSQSALGSGREFIPGISFVFFFRFVDIFGT